MKLFIFPPLNFNNLHSILTTSRRDWRVGFDSCSRLMEMRFTLSLPMFSLDQLELAFDSVSVLSFKVFRWFSNWTVRNWLWAWFCAFSFCGFNMNFRLNFFLIFDGLGLASFDFRLIWLLKIKYAQRNVLNVFEICLSYLSLLIFWDFHSRMPIRIYITLIKVIGTIKNSVTLNLSIPFMSCVYCGNV